MKDEVVNTEKKRWDRGMAGAVADRLLGWLAPRCEPERCCVAGSFRRGKAAVGDVEILYVPRIGRVRKAGEMFDSDGSLADMMLEDLIAEGWLMKRPNVNGTLCWGAENKLAQHAASGLPVDLFATNAQNWWVSLVIRTGPKELNVRLIESARARGLRLHAYGVFTHAQTGEVIVPQSEREVFELAGVPWLEPGDRSET